MFDLDQYIKKSYKSPYIEIFSEDQFIQSAKSSRDTISPRKREEDYFTIVRNARPKNKTKPKTTNNVIPKPISKAVEVVRPRLTPLIVEQICYQESENEYIYKYDINIFAEEQPEKKSAAEPIQKQPQKIDVQLQLQSSSYSVCGGPKSRIQEQAPFHNLKQFALTGWISHILASKNKQTNN